MLILPHRQGDKAMDEKLIVLKAEILKALGHPTRLAIVEMLGGGERCVCEINERIQADHSTVSRHLSILKKAGVLSDRKEGLKVYYKLEVPCILNFINCIVSVIESRAKKELAALKNR
jgi:DNA-binding transcriptional ArsR family regulator